MKAFDDSSKTGDDRVNHSLIELQQTIIRFIQRTPGNDHCCDCNSQNGECEKEADFKTRFFFFVIDLEICSYLEILLTVT